MKKVFIGIIAAASVALAGCEASGAVDTSKVDSIENYHITDGWCEGECIVSAEGHRWWCENPGNYTGYVEIAFDSKGTETLDDDELLVVIDGG